MRQANELKFSASLDFLKFKALLDDPDSNEFIDAFEERINDFYLEPARQLLKDTDEPPYTAFAAGLICVATIDCLARNEYRKEKTDADTFELWLRERIPRFAEPILSETFAYYFRDHFRNGLVHEGRVKDGSQFSDEIAELVKPIIHSKGYALLINPDRLIDELEHAFRNQLNKLKSNSGEVREFRKFLRDDFKQDISVAEQLEVETKRGRRG